MTDEEIETIASQYEDETHNEALKLCMRSRMGAMSPTKTYIKALLKSGWLPPDAAMVMRNEVREADAMLIDENIIGYGAGEPSLRKRPQDDVQCLTYAAAIRAMKE